MNPLLLQILLQLWLQISLLQSYFFLQNSILSPSEAFCESHRGSSGTLDKSCEKLTNGNCNSTSCCVWTSDKKCAAGNEKGPTFNTNANGQTNQLDYYYFEGKCYGTNCPN